ncbi:MAG: fasciclin domain-containing protein [Alphaproteobacteria bacterium]
MQVLDGGHRCFHRPALLLCRSGANHACEEGVFLAVPAVVVLVVAYGFVKHLQPANVVDTVRDLDQAGIMIEAVEAADLAAKLSGDGPFTVFAPTDSAFALLPTDKLDELLRPDSRGELTEVLSHHVVPQKLLTEQMAGKMLDVETLQGAKIEISAFGDVAKVGPAAVVQPDIEASNGVIHMIDRVILPD